jgi:hypothetical protein
VENAVRSGDLIREVLRSACAHSEIVILSTPYMRFETTFLRLEEDRFHCHANMTLEEARFGLRSPELKIRFPHGHHFYEGATRLLGLGRAVGRQSLQLAIPDELSDGDARRAYRVERVGRVTVTFSTRKYQLLLGTLVNVSTTGIRMVMGRTMEVDELRVGEDIHVAFTLGGSIRINAKVQVRYIKEKVFGAEFRPPLAGGVLEQVARWAFQRQEEDTAFAMSRAIAEQESGAADSGEGPGAAELVLVSASNELGERLTGMLADLLPPLRRVPPTIQSIRDLSPGRPTLVLFHLDSAAWESRKRLRMLAESLPAGLPYVVLGTGVETGLLFEVSSELKAAAAYLLPENPGSLFPRLLQGVCRKHFPG